MLLSSTALLVSVLTGLSPNATASLVETLGTLTAAATDAAAVPTALGDGGVTGRPKSASVAAMMLGSLRPVRQCDGALKRLHARGRSIRQQRRSARAAFPPTAVAPTRPSPNAGARERWRWSAALVSDGQRPRHGERG